MNRIQMFLLTAIVASLVFLGAIVATPSVTIADDDDMTEMDKQMEVIEDGLKSLRRSLRKDDAESKAKSLDAIDKIQVAAVLSKAEIPKMAAKLPADKRDKFIADFRKDMVKCLMTTCEMEIAVLEGDNEKAYDVHYKALKQMEDDGHEKFMEDED